jgi:cysteine rich repeat protein
METTHESRGRSINRSFIIAAVAGMLLGAAADVSAQGRGPCAEDAAKFCKDVQPGKGRMAQCLKEHENELSPSCKEHIAQMKQRGRGIHEACQDDALRLCKDVEPGRGGIYRCLKEHESELSSACREQLPEGRRGK